MEPTCLHLIFLLVRVFKYEGLTWLFLIAATPILVSTAYVGSIIIIYYNIIFMY